MNLGDQVRVLRKRWKLIGAIFLLCLLASVGATILQRKTYLATAEIFVSTATGDNAQNLAQGNSFAQARVQSYIDAVTSPAVTGPVAMQLSISEADLAGKISADAPSGKVLINVHVSEVSPARAALIANAVAKRFSSVVEDLEIPPGATQSPVKLTVIQPAVAPNVAASPKPYLNLGVGALAGIIVGLAIAFAREVLENTFKASEQITEAIDLPVLGLVPFDKQASKEVVALRASTHGARAEAFRHIRVNLDFIGSAGDSRVLAVTSALPGEGKSATAINIAAALAESGERVCLIEADLRRPTIASKLGLVGEVGLTSVLIGKATVEEVLQNAGHNFAVMTSGSLPPNPSELLHRAAFSETLAYIADKVDRVIIDTAPLLPVADGVEVAAAADATLLVIRYGKTTREQARRAVQSLGRVDVAPVGAILSMASERRDGTYNYYYSTEGGGRPTEGGGAGDDFEAFAARLQAPQEIDVSSGAKG